MRCDQLNFGRRLLTPERIEQTRRRLLWNDCNWVRRELMDGKVVEGVVMVPRARLLRMVAALEAMVGDAPTPPLTPDP